MVRANVFSPGVLFLCSYLYPCTWVWPFQVRAQKKMLQRFEKTNEMLTNVNTLSATRFVNNGHSYKYLPHLFSPRLDRATTDFKKHTAIVVDMKKDLDSIFRRIRNIKASLWCFPQVLDQIWYSTLGYVVPNFKIYRQDLRSRCLRHMAVLGL